MRPISFILIICFLNITLFAQTVTENIIGTVSFISTQNVYVRFKSTEGIDKGDTLYLSPKGELIPVLKVNNLSSYSCVCTTISSENLTVEQSIIARIKIKTSKPQEKVTQNVKKEKPIDEVSIDSTKKQSNPSRLKQKIDGSISASSYANFSNTSAANSTQLRYTLSLDARNIEDSKYSVETYLTFKHKIGYWNEVKSNVFNALKIYTLDVMYDMNKTTQISLGRKINQKISSMGAMDGLQAEKTINNFSFGALAGFRPDFTDYGFNSKLFQYGGYVAYNTNSTNNFSESSLAFLQQMNNSKTDRRFLAFQHSNTFLKNLFFFSIIEIDLYGLKDSLPKSTFNLTSFYLSLRYRMTKNLTVTGSYDARKNIIFYETYKTFLDRYLANEKRQSFNLQANYSITRNLMLGVQSGYRFLKSDPRPSKNIYSYLTYSQIPGLNISATISGTYLESNYLNGKILGASISRDLLQGKIQTTLGYRYLDYKFTGNNLNMKQNIAELSVFWLVYKNISFSLSYDGTFEQKSRYNMVYFQLRKRFSFY